MWRVFTLPVTRCGAETSVLQRPVHPYLLSVVQTGVDQESRAPRPGHQAGPQIHTPVADPRLGNGTNTRVLTCARGKTFTRHFLLARFQLCNVLSKEKIFFSANVIYPSDSLGR